MRIGQIAAFLMFRLGLFRLWRLMPRALRKRMVQKVTRLPQRRIRLDRPVSPVIIVGMFRSSTSFGWLARFLLDSIQSAGVPSLIKDISQAFDASHLAPPALDEPEEHQWQSDATLLIVLTPDQFGYGLSFLPRGSLERKYIIAYCPWELERLPREWMRDVSLLDEVWVPSTFVERAFRVSAPALRTKIVPCLLPLPDTPAPSRTRWNLRASTHVVMLIFSLRSGLERKNPFAAIRAFKAAFQAGEDATLVIKASDSDIEQQSWADLQLEIGDDPRIITVVDHLTAEDMWSLMATADTVISLHRAEGFGLVPAQAMMLGKAVIATGWSANLDYMNEANSVLVDYRLVPVADPSGRYPSDLSWAEPDIGQAAFHLKQLFDDPARRHLLGEQARQSIQAYIHTNQEAFRVSLQRDFQPA
jgi:glycosyltransferase involved in cell wall biosynthesis